MYRPGDTHLMRKGTAKQYRCPGQCWALEYARGNIISMLPFGIADTLSSTMDVPTLLHTVRSLKKSRSAHHLTPQRRFGYLSTTWGINCL